MFDPVNVSLVGAILALSLLLFLALGFQVPFALISTATIGFYLFLPGPELGAIGPVVWGSLNTPLLAAVPLFIFMGELFSRGRASSLTYTAMSPLAERIPGGLWHSNILACTIFSAASGSSVGTAAAMGAIATPELNERGYPRAVSYGSLAAGGTLGILIPPSLGMIIYGSLTGVSIGDLFVAGLIPGIVLAGLFSLYILSWSLRHPGEVPTGTRVGLLRSIAAAAGILPLLLVVGLVLGSIYLGVATPTESAAVGVAGFLILSYVYGPRSWTIVRDAIARTVAVTAMVLTIIMGAELLTHVVAYLDIPRSLTDAITELNVNRYLILLGLALVYLILGMFLDPISVMSLTLPVLFPAVIALGFDPVWFGVFVVVNIELGLITPPVGLNLFIIKGIDPTSTWNQVIRGSIPFAAVMAVFLVLLAAWPDIALWLVPE